jgi:hypothetical protein
MACDASVVKRALKTAVVVGTILLAINHYDLLLDRSRFSADRPLKMLLTICVPYLVSTYSSVGAMLEMRRRSDESPH